MKKILLIVYLLICIPTLLLAKDPFPVADSVDTYGVYSSTEASLQALPARAANTYRIKWEIRDVTGTQDLAWDDVAITTTTLNVSFSSSTATAAPYKVFATSSTPYTDDFPCWQGAIHIMSLTTPTTFYITEWYK